MNCQQLNSQSTVVSFEYVDFWLKILLFRPGELFIQKVNTRYLVYHLVAVGIFHKFWICEILYEVKVHIQQLQKIPKPKIETPLKAEIQLIH